jgi:hypothetical protein
MLDERPIRKNIEFVRILKGGDSLPVFSSDKELASTFRKNFLASVNELDKFEFLLF